MRQFTHGTSSHPSEYSARSAGGHWFGRRRAHLIGTPLHERGFGALWSWSQRPLSDGRHGGSRELLST